MAPKTKKVYPKLSKNQMKIDDNIENESCSTTWVDPKTVFEPFPNPKKSPLGPKKVKKLPQKLIEK